MCKLYLQCCESFLERKGQTRLPFYWVVVSLWRYIYDMNQLDACVILKSPIIVSSCKINRITFGPPYICSSMFCFFSFFFNKNTALSLFPAIGQIRILFIHIVGNINNNKESYVSSRRRDRHLGRFVIRK